MTDQAAHLKQLGSNQTDYTYERPSQDILETFKNAHFEADYEVVIDFPEFTSLCPKTGQPDFANIHIEYIPRYRCIESKSLKLYFFAWRSEGCFMETIVNRILEDLVAVLDPKWLSVRGEFNARGGLMLWPTASYSREEAD